MLLAGKAALVTGASGAIGGAIAHALAREGAAVAISGMEADLTQRRADELRQSGATVFAHSSQLSRRAETRALMEATLDFFGGRLDILVNNAGMSFKEALTDATDEHFDYQVEVNFASAFFLSQQAARAMIKHGGGRIVFISSTGAVAAHADTSVYDAMKAGLESLTRSLAVELGPHGIIVNAIEPGHILNGTDVRGESTPERLAHWSMIPLGRPGEPEDVARAVLFLVSPENTYMTGSVVRVDGGRTARSPVVVIPKA